MDNTTTVSGMIPNPRDGRPSTTMQSMGRTLLLAVLAVVTLGIGRISNASEFVVRQFALPAVELMPGPLAIDRNKAVWFAEDAGSRIGELRADGRIDIYRIPGANEQTQAIVAANDGNVWFTQTQTYDGSHNRVGYITQSGHVRRYPLRRANAFVSSIAADAKGGAWVSEFGAHRVAHVTGSGKITEFVLPGPAKESVRSIVLDPDGSVWALQDDAVVRLATDGSAQRTVVPLPESWDGIRSMVRAGPGSFWMTAYGSRGRGREIWRFAIPGRLTRYSLPDSDLGPLVLVSGADGSAWMAYDGTPSIAHIDASGNVTQYRLPFRGSDVGGMAADALADVWFANAQSEKIGVVGPHIGLEPRLKISPLTTEQSEIVRAWRIALRPRAGYEIAQVVADTLSVAGAFAVVGWSDENGNAATLLRRRAGRWSPVSVTNGNFYRLEDLTTHGLPSKVAMKLLQDTNVHLVPP